MSKRWTLKPQQEEQEIKKIQDALGICSILAQVLLHKGITNFEEAKHFFRPNIEHLHDPYLMKDMDKAVQRIKNALEEKENIMVYGDYDVDGVTSTTIVYDFLSQFTENIKYYIPDRNKEGYGISTQGIDFADDNKITLIISLDCGIKSVDKISYAKAKGIDFIICDHHLPDEIIPEAYAILNPKQKNCPYPYKELCGCGVGFKLLQALTSAMETKLEDIWKYLDLVAIAIAADIVPISGENRILMSLGIKQIESNTNRDIYRHFFSTNSKIQTSDIVFKLAPSINAAGRIEHAHLAVDILLEKDNNELERKVSYLKALNTERRAVEKEIVKEALYLLDEEKPNTYSTVLYKPDWHKGIIGIVASRIRETHYKPTVILTKSDDKIVGSARSISGYNIHQAIENCSKHLIQFGGHEAAAGLTMEEHKLKDFKQAFENYVKQSMDVSKLIPEIKVDAMINLSNITPKFIRILNQFAPFGPKNMNPVFWANYLKDTGQANVVGENNLHLKLNITQKGYKGSFKAIGFGLGNKLKSIDEGQYFSAVFSIEEDSWNNNTYVVLKLKDIIKQY